MTAEPKLPPFRGVSRTRERAQEIHAYGLQCFEAGRQQGCTQTDALWELARVGQEIESQGSGPTEPVPVELPVTVMVNPNAHRGTITLAAASQEIEAGPQWVSVTDRLPEKNTEVLIFFKHGGLAATGQYTGSPHDHEGWCYPSENVDDGNAPTVSHWMTLPAPPKG